MTDGVIKYDFDSDLKKPVEKELWEDMQRVRQRLYSLKFIGEKEGIGYGNISKRVCESSFVITATQTGDKNTLDENDFCIVKRWDTKEFYLRFDGVAKPSSESLTHASVYDLSPDIGAVIHIHNEVLWDFMLAKEYKRTKDVPYGSLEMADEVNEIYKESDPLKDPGFVMSGHKDGIIVFGRDIRESELNLLEIVSDFMDRVSRGA